MQATGAEHVVHADHVQNPAGEFSPVLYLFLVHSSTLTHGCQPINNLQYHVRGVQMCSGAV